MTHFWELILGTVLALLPIINPVSSMPVFLTITEGDSDAMREQQIRRACCYMIAILTVALVGGTLLMTFFGISIPGLRIAGGLLVLRIGFKMSVESGEDAGSSRREAEARAKRDISFTPLAMPLLSGPGSIAVTIGFTSLARGWLDYAAIILGILVVAAITYVVLRLSTRLVGLIGANGMHAMTRIMGFLLLCIGVQFVVNGLLGVAADPTFTDLLRRALAPAAQ